MNKVRQKTWHTCVKCKGMIKIGELCYEERTFPRQYFHEICQRKLSGKQGSLLSQRYK